MLRAVARSGSGRVGGVRYVWLAESLRSAGLGVVEVAGWQGRGAEMSVCQGVMVHHTAVGAGVAESAVEKTLAKGRAGLPGPLCQLALRRDGVWVVVASGRANHAGVGSLPWGGLLGNSYTLGVECHNDGRGERWPDVQAASLLVGLRALLAHEGLGADRVTTHAEYAPTRKVDPAGPVYWQPEGGTWDAAVLRAQVAQAADLEGDDDMAPLLIPCPQLGGTGDAYTVAKVGEPLRLVRWAQTPAWLPADQVVTAIAADNRTVELSTRAGRPHGKYTLV